MLLGLQNSPFAQTPGSHHSFEHAANVTSPLLTQQHDTSNSYDFPNNNANIFPGGPNGYMGLGGGVGEMMMQSQEIDMSTLGGDMMPWLEYLPQNMLEFFDNNGAVGGGSLNGATDLSGGWCEGLVRNHHHRFHVFLPLAQQYAADERPPPNIDLFKEFESIFDGALSLLAIVFAPSKGVWSW
jgi:hypothetical protein